MAEVDRAKFMAAAAKLRDKEGFHVVPVQGVAAALDELDSRSRSTATQKCADCGVEKPVDAFQSDGRDGHMPMCRECMKRRSSEGRARAIREGRRRNTMGAQIQKLMEPSEAPSSEGATGDPAPATQAPVVSTASDPNAGSDTGEEPVASSDDDEMTPDDWAGHIEIQIDQLRIEIERIQQDRDSFLSSERARSRYFNLLLKIADQRWARELALDQILERIERLITDMRFAELGEWPE